MDPRRVLVVGDDRLARGGVIGLCLQGGLVVAGDASVAESVGVAARVRPDVVLWAVGSSGQDLPDGLSVPVVALVSSPDSAAELLSAGVKGVLFHDANPDQITAAVLSVCSGCIVLDEELNGLLQRPAPGPDMAEPLTDRETQVLQLLSEGLSNKAIGVRLGISEHTAKFHVNSLLGKLGVDSRTEAVVQAARRGLVIL